jgi:hypothetical protein
VAGKCHPPIDPSTTNITLSVVRIDEDELNDPLKLAEVQGETAQERLAQGIDDDRHAVALERRVPLARIVEAHLILNAGILPPGDAERPCTLAADTITVWAAASVTSIIASPNGPFGDQAIFPVRATNVFREFLIA